MTPLLDIRGLNAWYGPSQALHGVNPRIGAGEVLALVGLQRLGRLDARAGDHGPRAVRRRIAL